MTRRDDALFGFRGLRPQWGFGPNGFMARIRDQRFWTFHIAIHVCPIYGMPRAPKRRTWSWPWRHVTVTRKGGWPSFEVFSTWGGKLTQFWCLPLTWRLFRCTDREVRAWACGPFQFRIYDGGDES